MKKYIWFIILCIIGLGSLVFITKPMSLDDLAVFFQMPKREKKENEIAWIQVLNSPIDYAIYQHPIDDTYYLSHDGDGNTTYYGAIFMELENQSDFSDPMVILYGHAMLDGAMFGSLKEFLIESYWLNHDTITIQLSKETRVYRVFAAYMDTNEHLLSRYNVSTMEAMTNYQQTIQETILLNGGVYRQPQYSLNQLLTLSTCDINDERRIIVQAELMTIEKKKE